MSYLQIMRFPNWFTAWADVLAGYIIVTGSDIKVFTLLALIVATSGIYAGGCALNDLCDRKIDSKERPSRPIPSGNISIFEAGFLTIICFGVGLASALYIGYKAFFVASVLVILVVLYDGFLKKLNVIGPLNMGACRALNLLLGMSPAITATFFLLLLPFFSLVYVFSLTVLSRFEVGGGVKRRGWVVFAGWLLVLVGLFCVFWTEPKIMSALLLCVLAVFTGPFLVKPSLQALFW
jgi:4-hydroxybenzoate polyprenyltransferase